MRNLINFLIISLFICTPLYAISTDSCFDTDTVVMLHMNGTDGSTTFTDSSSNTKTVTANGNAQIDTAQSQFGGASGLFDGSGDYLSIPDDADWDFGTGDFTIDLWFRSNVADPNTDRVFSMGDVDAGQGIHIRFDDTVLDVRVQGNSFTFAFNPNQNQWYHVTLTRNGSNLRAFADGTQIGVTETNSSNITVSSSLFIGTSNNGGADGGQYINGWVDELRVVKGTAVWTASFTSPSAEYTDCNAQQQNAPTAQGVSGNLNFY